MKKLVLHLGLPKTASTSIQETFFWNPAPLSKANYIYAKIAWPDGSFNSNHGFPMTVAFSDDWAGSQEIVRRSLPSDGLREHFMGQIKKAMSTDGNVIFSGEDIPLAMAQLQTSITTGFSTLLSSLGKSPNQNSHISDKNSLVIGQPDASPMTASISQKGQSALVSS